MDPEAARVHALDCLQAALPGHLVVFHSLQETDAYPLSYRSRDGRILIEEDEDISPRFAPPRGRQACSPGFAARPGEQACQSVSGADGS